MRYVLLISALFSSALAPAQADIRDSAVKKLVLKEARISRYRQLRFFQELETTYGGKYVDAAAETYEYQSCNFMDSDTSAYVYGKEKFQEQRAISFLLVEPSFQRETDPHETSRFRPSDDGILSGGETHYCDTGKTFESFYMPSELQQVFYEKKGDALHVTACRFSRVDVSAKNKYAYHLDVRKEYGDTDFTINYIPVTACITMIKRPGKKSVLSSTDPVAMLFHPAAIRFWRLNKYPEPIYLNELLRN